MKKILSLIVIIVSIAVSSCSNDFEEIPDRKDFSVNNRDTVKTTHSIPLQTALEELKKVLTVIDQQPNANNGYHSVKRRREIAKIEVVYKGMLNTKNSSQNSRQKMVAQSDSLLYVVDFADNGGSAVLAADNRIPETVLAVTEEGSISDEIYPLYEQGVNYGDQCLQNFNLYNQAENDYYVSQLRPVALEYCYEYAYDCISEGSIDNTIDYTITGSWVTNEKIYPKLKTAWHQGTPFNDAVPETRWFFWQSFKRGPAGCVPIAVAQIMAYHEYPKNLTCNGISIDWKGVKDICSIYDKTAWGSVLDRNAVAQLINNIGGWCSTIYSPDFAFALPRKARDCMSVFGYQNVVRDYGYSETKVVDMLRNDNPVFIAAISGVFGGHAWVIDGYIDRSRSIQGFNSTNTLVSSNTESQHLMHCNFGWKEGGCNGYYASNVFNLKNGALEREWYDTDASTKDNFNWAFHIISYNNPNL